MFALMRDMMQSSEYVKCICNIYVLQFIFQIPGTDVVIEKGTAIYICLYGLQRDPRFFENPLVFDPERFRNGSKISDAYIPFGIGPRMCIGE